MDGCNMLSILTGKLEKSPRKETFFFDDDGSLNA